MTPQRLASLAFFVFVLLQTPCFVLKGDLDEPIEVSPLQLSITYALVTYGDFFSFLKPWLVPGAYIRDAFAPFVRCLVHQKVGCDAGPLIDFKALLDKLAPPEHLEFFNSYMPSHKNEAVLGCAIIATAGALSAAVPVRLGVLGFLILGYAITMAGLTPLPPFMLMAFLVTFAAVAGDAQRRATQKLKLAKKMAQAAPATDAVASSSSSAEITPETKKEK